MHPLRKLRETGPQSAKLIKGAKIKVYTGAPHRLTAAHQDQVNAELLAFLRS